MNYITTDDFTIKSLGVQEIDVYDLEVEGNNNFFGNDILLHNSIYLECEELVKKYNPKDPIHFLDKACETMIKPVIGKWTMQFCNMMNCYNKTCLEMDREVLADTGIWTAKKKYMLNVHNSEGISYDDPILKIMGIESVRSSTPQVCREKINECVKIILNQTEEDAQEFIKNFKEEFLKLPIEEIAKNSSVNGVEKYEGVTKSVPIHVKGSLNFNRLLKKYKLEKKYEAIVDGDKIKYVYLIEPNISRDKIISFKTGLPKEFKLDDVVNYDLQFNKVFEEPIKAILKSIKWEIEKVGSLFEFL